MIKMLNYQNDSWLFEQETANDLITKGKTNLLFLNPEKQVLNLFSAFVKRSDFLKLEKINQPLQKTVYVKMPFTISKIISERSKDKKTLKITIEKYIRRRSNCNAAILRWFKKRIFPLFVVRILSKNKVEFAEWIENAEYFTDFLNKSRFYPPKTMQDLLHRRMVYLIGCSTGDGHIDKSQKRWSLVDGSSDKKRLALSGEFVQYLGNLLKSYGVSSRIRLIENKYDLHVNNKMLCRFLNFFFGLPFGPKKNTILQVPLILQYSESDLEMYFWRGCFDTDGYAGFGVSFCSSDENLIKQCYAYLKSKQIQSAISERNITVISADMKKFSVVGFAHPRKQIEYLSTLQTGATFKEVKIKNSTNVDPRLLQIHDLLRIDRNGYRIRINTTALRKKEITYLQVQHIIKELFGYELQQAANGMYYFKSKEIYEYLQSLFIYGLSWEPIREEEEDELTMRWNDVWLKW